MRCAGLALVFMLLAYAPALAVERRVEHHVDHRVERACLTAAQAREKIAQHKFAEPFRLMLAMAKRFRAEAIGARLCRKKDDFIYEIMLLRRDGRVIHVYMKASNGQFVRATNIK
ncbi:MAG TPA: hypothetical protein VIJ06_05705 [Methylovirgula sp.]